MAPNLSENRSKTSSKTTISSNPSVSLSIFALFLVSKDSKTDFTACKVYFFFVYSC